MIRAFQTAATGMDAQQLQVDNTANNLANLNTTGFKRSELAFQDLIYLNLLQPGTEQLQGTAVPTGLQVGNGVRVAGNTKIFTEGTLTNTGNPLDLAIQGDGFFQITLPDGTLRYTRDGSLPYERQRRAGHLRWLCPVAEHQHPQRRAVDRHRHGRHGVGDHHRDVNAADGGPDPAGALPQRGRPQQPRGATCSTRPAPPGSRPPGSRARTAPDCCSRGSWSSPTWTWCRSWST